MLKEEVNIDTQIVELAPSLYRYALSLTLDEENAKDLYQQTCYKALSNREKFDLSTNLKAWLLTIMKNTFINDYRKKVRGKALFNNEVNEYILSNKPAESNPESDLQCKEIMVKVASLEPSFRIPFQMYEGGYKYQEIAEELGLKLGTVKSRIHISRQKLKDALEE